MSVWEKLFSKITFKDYPNTSTPLNADNLNKMTDAIDGIDNRVVELNSNLSKVNKVYLSSRGNTIDSNGEPIWTYRIYSDGLIETWRYGTISAKSGFKRNTFSLPFTMKDTEYIVSIAPTRNGNLVNSIWVGTLSGEEGRTTTTVQVSMNCEDSDNTIGIMVRITGFLAN